MQICSFHGVKTLSVARNSIVRDGFARIIDETGTELAHAGAVHGNTTEDVPTLLQGDPVGDGAVHTHVTVARQKEDFLTVDPPSRCLVGANCEPDILDVLITVDDRHGPENDAVAVLVETGSKAE